MLNLTANQQINFIVDIYQSCYKKSAKVQFIYYKIKRCSWNKSGFKFQD